MLTKNANTDGKCPLTTYSCTTHTHTHPFNGPLSGTTQVSRYQKGETNLDFTEARGSEWQWHQLGHMQVCTLLQTDNHASTPPLSFLQAGRPSCRPTNRVRALKAIHTVVQYLNNSTVNEAVWSPVSTIIFPLPWNRLCSTLHMALTHTAVNGKYPVSWKSWQQLSATIIHCQ